MLKKQLPKIISSVLIACMALGITGAVLAQPGRAYAAESTVGVVDYAALLNNHPDIKAANESLKAAGDQVQKEYQDKGAGLSDQEKQNLSGQLNRQVEQKRQELLQPILAKINAAVKTVADAKGLTVVVGKAFVIYGGQDITKEVAEKLGEK